MSNMIAHRISHHYFNKSHYVTRELGVPLEISDFAWELHYISFGFMFALIAVLTLFNVVGFVRDDRQKKFQRRHYFTWMNGALFYFSTIMAVALLGKISFLLLFGLFLYRQFSQLFDGDSLTATGHVI